jgi:hypothetical protein
MQHTWSETHFQVTVKQVHQAYTYTPHRELYSSAPWGREEC